MAGKSCCFTGHGKIYDISLKAQIKEQAAKLIEEEQVKIFRVGNYGNFDSYSAAAINELKKIYTDIRLELVIPYLTKSIIEYKEQYAEKYDCILMADIPEKTPKQYRIIKANEYMVNTSDYMICYVSHSFGGAAAAVEYAKKRKHIQIFNLFKNAP